MPSYPSRAPFPLFSIYSRTLPLGKVFSEQTVNGDIFSSPSGERNFWSLPGKKKGITALHAHPASWNGYAFDLQTDGSGRQGSSGFHHSFFRGLIVLSRIILYAFIILFSR
jgi:hypothetical protein